MEKRVSRDRLLEYIKTEQIAFQFGDGIITFTKPETGYNYEDAEFADLLEYLDLLRYLREGSKIEVVTRNQVYQLGSEFKDFANWILDEDMLITIDDCLVLCLPNYDNFENVLESA